MVSQFIQVLFGYSAEAFYPIPSTLSTKAGARSSRARSFSSETFGRQDTSRMKERFRSRFLETEELGTRDGCINGEYLHGGSFAFGAPHGYFVLMKPRTYVLSLV